MKIKWKVLAVTLGFLSVSTGDIALAATEDYYYPYNYNRLYDATYWEWNGTNLDAAKQIAGNKYCIRRGFRRATRVDIVTSGAVAPGGISPANGTNRFSLYRGTTTRPCFWCRWYISYVFCTD